MNNLLGFFF